MIQQVKALVPVPVKRIVRDPILAAAPRRTAYRRLRRSAPEHPVTFSEKVRYKMAFDRSPILRTFADKVAARAYIADRVGAEALPQLLGVYDRVDQVRGEDLPREFALKAAHGSGAVARVWGGAARGRLPTADQRPTWAWRGEIHPDDLDRAQLARLADGWLHLSYELTTAVPEWAYGDLPRRLLAEEVLRDADGRLPSDYKFFMMHGQCSAIQVHTTRFLDHCAQFHGPAWDVLPGTVLGTPLPTEPIPRPENLDRMLEIAHVLSREVDAVRVDLYDLGDRVVVGELTNYPNAGSARYDPPEFDRLLGALWTPPESYG